MTEIQALLMSRRMLARVGLRAILEKCPEISLVGEATGTAEAVEMAVRLRPSVVIIDAMADDTDPAETTSHLLRRCQPVPRVLVLANKDDRQAQTAIQAGATGLVLSKCAPEEFVAAIRLAAAGYRLVAPPGLPRPKAAGNGDDNGGTSGSGAGTGKQPVAAAPKVMDRLDRVRLDQLTEREFDVLQLVARGFGNAEISRALHLSESTVKSHIRSILVKLGLRNRVHTVIYAYEVGFIRIGANPIAHHLRAADSAGDRLGYGRAVPA